MSRLCFNETDSVRPEQVDGVGALSMLIKRSSEGSSLEVVEGVGLSVVVGGSISDSFADSDGLFAANGSRHPQIGLGAGPGVDLGISPANFTTGWRYGSGDETTLVSSEENTGLLLARVVQAPVTVTLPAIQDSPFSSVVRVATVRPGLCRTVLPAGDDWFFSFEITGINSTIFTSISSLSGFSGNNLQREEYHAIPPHTDNQYTGSESLSISVRTVFVWSNIESSGSAILPGPVLQVVRSLGFSP